MVWTVLICSNLFQIIFLVNTSAYRKCEVKWGTASVLYRFTYFLLFFFVVFGGVLWVFVLWLFVFKSRQTFLLRLVSISPQIDDASHLSDISVRRSRTASPAHARRDQRSRLRDDCVRWLFHSLPIPMATGDKAQRRRKVPATRWLIPQPAGTDPALGDPRKTSVFLPRRLLANRLSTPPKGPNQCPPSLNSSLDPPTFLINGTLLAAESAGSISKPSIRIARDGKLWVPREISDNSMSNRLKPCLSNDIRWELKNYPFLFHCLCEQRNNVI